jgi:hypothetical protein
MRHLKGEFFVFNRSSPFAAVLQNKNVYYSRRSLLLLFVVKQKKYTKIYITTVPYWGTYCYCYRSLFLSRTHINFES